MKTIQLKLGSSLSVSGRVKLPSGTWVLTSSIARNTGALIQSLTVSLTPLVEPTATATHTLSISATPSQTILWPEGNLQVDLRFAETGGTVIHSPTFIVATERAMTNAA